jgi:hypothetical protein
MPTGDTFSFISKMRQIIHIIPIMIKICVFVIPTEVPMKSGRSGGIWFAKPINAY